MSLISYIERLRGKPESERKKIAIGIALVVTLFIALIWIFTVTSSLSHRAPSAPVYTGEKTSVYDEVKKSWNSIVESMSTLFSGTGTTESTSTTESVGTTFDAMEGIPAGLIEDTATDTSQQ